MAPSTARGVPATKDAENTSVNDAPTWDTSPNTFRPTVLPEELLPGIVGVAPKTGVEIHSSRTTTRCSRSWLHLLRFREPFQKDRQRLARQVELQTGVHT